MLLLLSMSAAAVRLGCIAPRGDASVRQHLSLGRAVEWELSPRHSRWRACPSINMCVGLKRLRGTT